MKSKVVYLLLDFDGVLALYLSQLNPESAVYQKKLASIKKIDRSKFQSYAKTISNIIETRLASSTRDTGLVILAVGSARQTRQHDEYASKYNDHNGLCFPLFADLAARKGWLFNPLLVPDCPTPPYTFQNLGKTMGPFEKNTQGHHIFKENAYSDDLYWSENKQLLNEGKKGLFAIHLAYIQQYYPASKYDVTLEFWDDSPLHIKTFRNYAEKYRSTHPVTLVSRHFNWSETSKKFDGNEENFKRELEKNIDTQTHTPLKKAPRLGSFSFWDTQSTNALVKLNIPSAWFVIGFSALFLTCALMNNQKPQLNEFKPKSIY